MPPSLERVSKSTELRNVAAYDIVAAEYYDDSLHPTCADFRTACKVYLSHFATSKKIYGKVAEVGCGRSQLTRLLADKGRAGEVSVLLVDASTAMLESNENLDCSFIGKRVIDVECESFGDNEFDWVFCLLADPYNTLAAWRHVAASMRLGATCVVVVPSFVWASKFRSTSSKERVQAAYFITRSGRSVYLPSFIYDGAHQTQLLLRAGLRVTQISTIDVRDMPSVLSPKISEYLSPSDAVIDVYEAIKTT